MTDEAEAVEPLTEAEVLAMPPGGPPHTIPVTDWRSRFLATVRALQQRDAQLLVMREALEQALHEGCECVECGEPGEHYFTTEGDGPYWLCGKKDAEHAMPERYAAEDELEFPARPLDAARAALSTHDSSALSRLEARVLREAADTFAAEYGDDGEGPHPVVDRLRFLADSKERGADAKGGRP